MLTLADPNNVMSRRGGVKCSGYICGATWELLLLHPEVVAAVVHEGPMLLEGAAVQEYGDSLPRSQLVLGVLLRDRRVAPAPERLLPARFDRLPLGRTPRAEPLQVLCRDTGTAVTTLRECWALN